MTSDFDFHWWRADALCAQVGPDLFFLKRGDPGKEAKSVCRLCPVRALCLADSLDADVEHGIFGGFGRDDRRRLAHEVAAGANPIQVAVQAIHKENREHARAADHRRRARTGGDRDRVRPRAEGRAQERVGLVARGDGPAGL